MEFFIVFAMLILVGMQNLICVIIGLKVGLSLTKGEEIRIPNPIEAVKEHREQKAAQKEAEKEQNRIDTIMRNIDNYDGTGKGQEEV